MNRRVTASLSLVPVFGLLTGGGFAYAGPFPAAGSDTLPSRFDFTIEFVPNSLGIPVSSPTLVTSTGTTTFTRGAPAIPVSPPAQTQYSIFTDISLSHTGSAFGGFSLTGHPVNSLPSGGQVREQLGSASPGHFPADSLMEVFMQMYLASAPNIEIWAEDALFMPSTAAVAALPYPVGTTHRATGWVDEDVVSFTFADGGAGGPFSMRLLGTNHATGVQDGYVGYITFAEHVITPEPATGLLILATALIHRRKS